MSEGVLESVLITKCLTFLNDSSQIWQFLQLWQGRLYGRIGESIGQFLTQPSIDACITENMEACNSHGRFGRSDSSCNDDDCFILKTREGQFFSWQIGFENLLEYCIMFDVVVCFVFKIPV